MPQWDLLVQAAQLSTVLEVLQSIPQAVLLVQPKALQEEFTVAYKEAQLYPER
jgi:hypothetical protein